MRPRALAVLAAVAALAGCADSHHASDGSRAKPSPAVSRGGSDSRVIRGWSAAIDAGDYGRAARYFAPGAIVQQDQTFRLADRAAAIEFNRSLPCRADVTSIVRRDRASLASFKLREGFRGRCREGGTAQVRFVIRSGRIREWRQLPTAPPVPGSTA